MTLEQLNNKVKGLQEELAKVKETSGGILSGGHILDRVLTGKDADEYLKYFEERNWEEMSKWGERRGGGGGGGGGVGSFPRGGGGAGARGGSRASVRFRKRMKAGGSPRGWQEHARVVRLVVRTGDMVYSLIRAHGLHHTGMR